VYREDLIKQWLWMQAAAFALQDINNHCSHFATPQEDDRRKQPWSETCRKSYEYALEHWEFVLSRASTCCGASSGHGRYDLGFDVTMQGKKATAKYRNVEVTVTMAEIKRLIERMLKAPEMEERQMTMFDMLVEQAPQSL